MIRNIVGERRTGGEPDACGIDAAGAEGVSAQNQPILKTYEASTEGGFFLMKWKGEVYFAR
jgi:hypothetical protein